MRALSSDEAKVISAKAKAEGSRPQVYNSTTGTLFQISKEFEAFLILAPSNFKAKAATFISNILLFDINNMVVRNNLMKRWCDDEITDIETEIKGYKDILDTYDELQPQLAGSIVGFEDISEVNTFISSFTLMLGDFVEQRDSLSFAKASSNVLSIREQGKIPADIKQEIESYARLLLTYD
jgi:hypothetical protein